MVNSKTILKWIPVIGIPLCGIILSPYAYDKSLTTRHLMWCAMVLAMVLVSTEIRLGKIHIFAFGYLGFVLLSGFFAVNKSEWVYSSCRALLAVSYISVLRVDEKTLTKAMLLLGVIFTVYFWWEYSKVGSFHICKGLMCQKNYWACAQFMVIPFCYYAVTSGFWKRPALLIMPLMILNILLLNTRSVILAVGMFGLLVFIYHKNLRMAFLVTGIAILSVLCLSDKFISSVTLGQRLGQWQASLRMIEANPMGVGAGNWWIMFPEYADDFYYKDLFTRIIFRHPHNNFVWIASEIGIGVVFYIGMFLYALKHASKYLAIGLLGGMVIACFSALHERPFATLMLMTFIALACPMKSYKQPKLWVTVVIFCIVVFGFRYRSATWNRKMRGNLKPDVAINLCEGDSPFSSLTHVGLPWAWWEGMSYFELKRYNEAIPLLKRAQLQNPYNIYALNGAGIAYGIEGRRGKSAMFFAKAIEICPEFEDAKVNLKKLNRN